MAVDTDYMLITSLGNRRMDKATYALDGRETPASFSAAALAALREPPPSRIVVLLTPEAREANWIPFCDECVTLTGMEPEAWAINAERPGEDVQAYFQVLNDICGADEQVVLEITNAFRSLPIVYLACLNYLSALRGVRIVGIYYGAREENRKPTPLVDLTPVLSLSDWSYAVRAFREGGSLGSVRDLLNQRCQELEVGGSLGQALSSVRDAVVALDRPLTMGLPLETAIAAAGLLRCLDGATEDALAPLLAGAPALEPLRNIVRPFERTSGHANKKGGLKLTPDEQRRQLGLVRWYTKHGDVPRALLLLREWMISQALWAAGQTDQWFDGKNTKGSRASMERALGALAQRSRYQHTQDRQVDGDDAPSFADLWKEFSDERNFYAHAGFRPDSIKADTEQKLCAAVERAQAKIEDRAFWSVERPHSGGRLLITPLGKSGGVLFSAIKRVQPERLLILSSEAVGEGIKPALTAANWSGPAPVIRKLNDALAGFAEADALVKPIEERDHKRWTPAADELRDLLLDASEVVVNLTGGTTALGYAVQRLAEAAARLGVTMRRAALIDRRSVDEQRRDPYVLGELIWLDGVDGGTPE